MVGVVGVIGVESPENSALLVPEFGRAHGTGDEQTQMTARETDHVNVPGERLRQGGTDPVLETCQATGIAQQAAERAFSGCHEAGARATIRAPGTAAGFIGGHGIFPA